jgi:uncharacterized repeat protein (TIGR03803 family)
MSAKKLLAVAASAIAVTLATIQAQAATERVIYSFGSFNGDALFPQGRLINVGGTVYGTTPNGGIVGGCFIDGTCGTVFKITTAGVETLLHQFSGKGLGNPAGSLLPINGRLYGGTYLDSGVFSVTREGTYQEVYSSKAGALCCTAPQLINVGGHSAEEGNDRKADI